MKCDSCVKKNDCIGYGKTPCCGAYVSEKKPTNADRIRSMSDEELADFVGTYFSCEYNCAAMTDNCDQNCGKVILEWLQSEAESESK